MSDLTTDRPALANDDEIEATPASVMAGVAVLKSRWLQLLESEEESLFSEVVAAILEKARLAQ